MDATLILADLREQFGAKKAVLYVDELAEALGKTTDAVRSLVARDGFPVPILTVGGRPAASIHAVADWLAGNPVKAAGSKKSRSDHDVSVPAPKRHRQSMANFLVQVQAQQAFLGELGLAMQRQIDAMGVHAQAKATSQAVFDDQEDLFYVDANGLVIAYARDEEVAPQLGIDLEWLTWTDALVRPWSADAVRLGWLALAESDSPGISAQVEAQRKAILGSI
jgi:hypothetical protein